MSSSPSTTAAGQGRVTAITAGVHPDIIQTHILKRLDGPTIASFSCVSSQFYSDCMEESLWKTLCNSNWPSTTDTRVQEIIATFPSGHRSFYSDSYSTVRCLHHRQQQHLCHHLKSKPTTDKQESIQTTELISAVDIHYGNDLIYSKVAVTGTSNCWFNSSPLRLDLLKINEIVQTPLKYDGEEGVAKMEKNMRLSWILIDPAKKRAVNLSSLRPVEVRQHQFTGKILVDYATIMPARVGGRFVKCGVDVTCEGKDGVLHLKEVGMHVEDIEGNILSGMDSLEIFYDVMEGKRVSYKIKAEKKMYETFMLWRDYYLSNPVV